MITAKEARVSAAASRIEQYNDLINLMECGIEANARAGLNKFEFVCNSDPRFKRFKMLLSIKDYSEMLLQYYHNLGFSIRYNMVNENVKTITVEW